MKAQVIPLRKNFNLSRFNVAPVEWRKIRTNDDKKLSSSEIELLWTIHRLAMHHHTNNLELSYSVLSRECGLEVSQRQLNRYLHKLSSTSIIDFYTRRSVVNYDKKLIIKIDFEILENLMTVRFDSQVCQSNMTGYNIDKNKLKNKEIEDSSYRAISSISKKERIKNKKEKVPKQSNDLTCHPERAASHSDCSTEKPNEETMKAYDWEDPAKKLDLAISKSFDTQMVTTLTTDINYLHIPKRNTLQLILKKKLAISEQDQTRLKQLIRDIYGNDIKTALVRFYDKKAKVVKIPQLTEKVANNNHEPPKINNPTEKPLTKKTIASLAERYEIALIDSWFNRMQITEDINNITFEASDTVIDYVTNNFLSGLTKASDELKVIFTFLAKNRFGEIRLTEISEKGKF